MSYRVPSPHMNVGMWAAGWYALKRDLGEINVDDKRLSEVAFNVAQTINIGYNATLGVVTDGLAIQGAVTGAALSTVIREALFRAGVVGLSLDFGAGVLKVVHAYDRFGAGSDQFQTALTDLALNVGLAASVYAGLLALGFTPLVALGAAALVYEYGADGVGVIMDVFNQLFGTSLPRNPLKLLKWDPLILDLGGDGIALSSLGESSVHFDFNNDGFAERTGWVPAPARTC